MAGFPDATATVLRWGLAALVAVVIAWQGRRHLTGRPVLRELAIVLAAYFTYFGTRALTEGSEPRALTNAERVVDFERALQLHREADLQNLVLDQHELVTAANWVYIWGHWPVILVLAAWLFIYRPLTYRTLRNAFLVSGSIGLVIFTLFPVAPPRLAGIGMEDTVTLHSHAYRVLQPPALMNSYAAVPSLHFGWNLLVGMALFQEARNRGARLFGVLSPVAMCFAIVLTANHYLVDAAAGAVVALAGLALACHPGALAPLARAGGRVRAAARRQGPPQAPLPDWR